jgi:hypothetical protein
MSRNRVLAGAVGVGILAATALAAPAAAVSLVVDGVDGTFTSLQPRSPGVYGVELRGGRTGAADWEIGVGNQTSVGGKFNQGEFNWAASSDPYAFNLSWTASGLSITVGGVTVTDAGDGKGAPLVGDTLRIGIVRSATLNLATLDGVAFNQSFGSGSDLLFFSPTAWGGNGFTATGTLAITGGGGSANAIRFSVGDFAPNPAIPEPATWAMMIAGFGLVGATVRRRRTDVATLRA